MSCASLPLVAGLSASGRWSLGCEVLWPRRDAPSVYNYDWNKGISIDKIKQFQGSLQWTLFLSIGWGVPGTATGLSAPSP